MVRRTHFDDPPCKFCGEPIYMGDWYDQECEVCGIEVCKACVDHSGIPHGHFLHNECDPDRTGYRIDHG